MTEAQLSDVKPYRTSQECLRNASLNCSIFPENTKRYRSEHNLTQAEEDPAHGVEAISNSGCIQIKGAHVQ